VRVGTAALDSLSQTLSEYLRPAVVGRLLRSLQCPTDSAEVKALFAAGQPKELGAPLFLVNNAGNR